MPPRSRIGTPAAAAQPEPLAPAPAAAYVLPAPVHAALLQLIGRTPSAQGASMYLALQALRTFEPSPGEVDPTTE